MWDSSALYYKAEFSNRSSSSTISSLLLSLTHCATWDNGEVPSEQLHGHEYTFKRLCYCRCYCWWLLLCHFSFRVIVNVTSISCSSIFMALWFWHEMGAFFVSFSVLNVVSVLWVSIDTLRFSTTIEAFFPLFVTSIILFYFGKCSIFITFLVVIVMREN